MVTDSIADGLTILRNAARARKKSVTLPSSRMIEAIFSILQRERYVDTFKTFHDGKKKYVRVNLRYRSDEKPVFQALKRISKPGLRRYVGVDSIPRVLNGMGIAVLSTSKGVMSDSDARRERVGGELLCEVW